MNAVGIDVSSRKSTVAVLRPLGEVVCLPFDVTHDIAGLASLVEKLKALDGETRVVMEHTGRYYEAVEKALHEAGFFVCAVNPLLIKEYGANSLRRVKTDKADAVKIARYALDNWADLRDFTPMDAIRYDLKTLNRQFQLASKQRTASANNLIALLEQSFPGIRKCFDSPVRSDGTQKWVDFAHSFWHVDCVRKQPFPAFCERYRKWCKRHAYLFKLSNAEEVYALAKRAVVLTPKSKVVKVLVQEAANQLISISRSVEVYRAEMDRLAGEWIFSSDANANFEGLLAVNRGICMPQMAEKASPDAPPNCAVVPQCNIWSINSFGKEVFRSFIHGKVLLVHQSTQKDPVVNILSPDICIAHSFS